MWGKKKREKRDLARECLLLVKPLSFWSQNTRKEETKKNKFFQRRQNSLVLAAKFISSKYLVRDLIFVISLVHRVRV